jgi:hypothetical protein
MGKLKILILLILTFSFSSCNIYSDEEIIEFGEEVINLHDEDLLNLFYIVNELITDTFTMHSVSISNTTDQFVFFTFSYDLNNHNKKIFGKSIKIGANLENKIRNFFPKKKTTSLVIFKEVFVSFELYRCRNKQYEYAKLLFVNNKGAFIKLFPEYEILETSSAINNKSNWVYFYDDQWAITTSSDIIRLTTEECEKLLQ